LSRDLVNEAISLNPPCQQTRRVFLRNASATGLIGGFALASDPVMSQAIRTNFEGLEADEIHVEENGVDLYAYMAKPVNAKGPLPIVIVVSEIFGVHEHIADMARRFAKQGYMAIAPEFFTRAGDPTSLGTIAEVMSQIVAKTPDKQLMGDISACLSWAGKNQGDLTKVGITGFCWGGRVTWLACAQIPQMKAGVAWYGRLVGDQSENFPLHPVDIAASLKGPVLGLYGGDDPGIPLNTVEKMREALAQASVLNPAAKKSLIEVYPNAPHAFNADYRASYRADAAKDGWLKCLAWFKSNGVA
jgi:carboxymethylenebutenolidase